jgi:hypothetical protein
MGPAKVSHTIVQQKSLLAFDRAAGADKSAKVTVYYTEKAGTKTAHFVKQVF